MKTKKIKTGKISGAIDQGKLNYFKINLMRVYLKEYWKSPVKDWLHEDAGHKVRTVKRMFSGEELQQMCVELPGWLALVTGKRTPRNYAGPGKTLRALENRLITMDVLLWFALLIIVAESQAKPVRSGR